MWVRARANKDFSEFTDKLSECAAILREKALTLGPAIGKSPDASYDVALDAWERGFTSARAEEFFAELKYGLVPLLAELRAKAKTLPPPRAWLTGPFDEGPCLVQA